MFKRFFLALALAAGLLSPALGAGTIPLSLTQRFDNTTHLPLNGGKLYFIQAGTTSTPQNAYQDSALTIPWANPLTLDSGGNIPQLFFADGQIKIRLTNAQGVTQLTADNILVVGASSGGGGGGSVDATTVLATGDIKARYGTGTLSGFVRANGRTIGSSTSGATERANADTQALFEYLWTADANLTVSTGRGASANADWVANKTIALPDWRGRAIAALDDMGNSAAGRLTSTYFGTSAIVLGAAGGAESQTLTIAQMPAHDHGAATGVESASHTHNMGTNVNSASVPQTAPTVAVMKVDQVGGAGFGVQTGTESATHTHPITAQGGGAAHPIASPMMLATVYLKL